MIGTQCNMVSVLAVRGVGEASRVLIVRRSGRYLDGVWSYTAGHIEAGERAWQAALRELAEETALAPQALYATSFCETFYDASADCIQVVPAFVARIAADAQVRLNHEASACRWVSFAEAAQVLPFGSQRDLLAHVKREFIERAPMEVLRMPTGG